MILGQIKRIQELSSFNLRKEGNKIPILAFTSGKGGTGKTTLAVNFANLLAKKGKRVLLIDFDINFANVHIMINIFPENTLSEFFRKNYAIENIIYEANGNLHYIFGETGFWGNYLNKAKLTRFFNEIRETGKYDVIILDTSSGGSPDTLDILGFATSVIVVATSEPTAVMDAYAIVKLLKLNENSSDIKTIINKVKSKKDAATAFENIHNAVKHFLKSEIEMIGFIHDNREIRNSSFSQVLFSENLSDKRIKNDIEKIVFYFQNLIRKTKNGSL